MAKKETPPHALLRLLIREKSQTEQGFMLDDARGMEAAHYASRHACRAVVNGTLFRAKVSGHPIHYMHTQQAAERMTKWMLANPPTQAAPKPSKLHKTDQMRTVLIEKGATPQGAAFDDCAHIGIYYSVFSKEIRVMMAVGDLYRAKVKGHTLRYFSTLAAAAEWMRTTPPTRPKPRVYVSVAKPKPPKLIKPPKLAKPVKVAAQVIKQSKPYIAPKPRIDAEIVHTSRTRYDVRPFVDLRSVSVPYRRIGSPEWRAGVGA